MFYKVLNICTEEVKKFNTYKEADDFIIQEVERLNAESYDNDWTVEDFEIYLFNTCERSWEQIF